MKKKIRFQQLEARVLLDAAGLVTAVEGMDDPIQPSEVPDHSTDELDSGLVAHLKGDVDGKDSAEASPLMIESSALVVVDTTIENFESLISDLSEDTEILLLEGDEDGLDQISSYVEGRDDFTSIHILSNASLGDLQLGSTHLTNDNLSEQADQFSRIEDSITEDGRMLVYACDFANGEASIESVVQLNVEDDLDAEKGSALSWEPSSDTQAASADESLGFDISALDTGGETFYGTGTDTADDFTSLGVNYFGGASDDDSAIMLDSISDFYSAHQESELAIAPVAAKDGETDTPLNLEAVIENVQDTDLIVVDSGVEDFESLLRDIPENAEV